MSVWLDAVAWLLEILDGGCAQAVGDVVACSVEDLDVLAGKTALAQ